MKYIVVFRSDRGDALQANRKYAQNNEPKEKYIKLSATGCVSPENRNK